LKNGFAAAQKSFSLLVSLNILVIDYLMLNSITERRKTFDSLLANRFSAVVQSSFIVIVKVTPKGKSNFPKSRRGSGLYF